MGLVLDSNKFFKEVLKSVNEGPMVEYVFREDARVVIEDMYNALSDLMVIAQCFPEEITPERVFKICGAGLSNPFKPHVTVDINKDIV
jgi:hypothetical protein